MLLWATFDQNSVIVRVKILDSAVTTGAGKTGLTNASSGLLIATIADSEATATVYTVAGSNVESITTLGTYAAPSSGKCRFKEVDATNHPGVYELQFSDARFSVASAKSLLISISGASGAAQCDAVIPLPVIDLFAAVVPANLTQIEGVAQSATDLKDFADTGYDPATHKVQGVVLTDTVTTYTGNTPQTGDNFARLGAPAGASVSADVAAVKAETASVQSDTNDIQTRLPAALVSGRMDSNMQAAANDVITSAVLAASAITEIQAGLSTLDAAGVRSAVGLASANLDAQLSAIAGFIDTEVAAIIAAVAALNDISVADVLAGIIEGSITLKESMRIANAANAGKVSGAATTNIKIRDLADSLDRIDATVDADGNRTAVTLDLT